MGLRALGFTMRLFKHNEGPLHHYEVDDILENYVHVVEQHIRSSRQHYSLLSGFLADECEELI